MKVTVFLTDVDDRPKINPVRQEVFGPRPSGLNARRGRAARRPGAKIEVEAIAVTPERS